MTTVNFQLLKLISWLLKFIPSKWLIDFAKYNNWFFRRIFPRTYQLFLKNTQVVYAQESFTKQTQIARECFNTHIWDLLLSIKYFNAQVDEMDLEVKYHDVDQFKKKIKPDRGLILVTPHLDFRILGPKFLQNVIDKPLIAPFYGIDLISKEMFGKILPEIFSDNFQYVFLGDHAGSKIEAVLKQQGVVVLAIDSVVPAKYKRPVKFFGHDFEIATGPLWLAEKYDLEIIFIYGIMSGKTNYDIYWEELGKLKNNDQDLNRLVRGLEIIIKKFPGHWDLPHDYWPNINTNHR